MDYEVLNSGDTTISPQDVNVLLCLGGIACIDPNCSNLVCPSNNNSCSSDNDCDVGGDGFMCQAPTGFGCRYGCGGATGTVCIDPYSS